MKLNVRQMLYALIATLLAIAMVPEGARAMPDYDTFYLISDVSITEPDTAMAYLLVDGRLYLTLQEGKEKGFVDSSNLQGSDDWESDDPDNPYYVREVIAEGDIVLTDGKSLFSGCEHLERVDFATVDNTGADCTDMFKGCTALRSITVGEFYDTSLPGAFPENPLGGDQWWSVGKQQWVKTSDITSTYTKVADTYLAQRSSWARLSGETALDTAVAVTSADGAFPDGCGGTVLLATSDGYWDALAATGLAGMRWAPVLITPRTQLASQTKAELQRIKPEKVLVMGGKAAISEAVEDQVREAVPGVEIVRMAGADAPGTAVKIFKDGVEDHNWYPTAIVATSNGYWDALSIAPYAYWRCSPIFLTSYVPEEGGQVLGDEALQALKSYGFERVVIVGGKAAVSAHVEEQLASVGIGSKDVIRLAGKTALDTSAKIAEWELAEGMTLSRMAVATSNGYWDALTGAALCGQQSSVLVLVSTTDGYTAFDAVYDPAQVIEGHVFGGRAAVSDASLEYFKAK